MLSDLSCHAIEPAKSKRLVLLLMLMTAVVLCMAITEQSLWIDEADTAYFASHDTLTNLFSRLTAFRTAEPQKPLYLMYIWGWAKLFGTSEYALRAANLPFAILLVVALGWTSWRLLGRPVLWVVFCLSPFVWFYMNEARPYIAIVACAAVSTGALMAYLAERETYGKIAPWLCLSALWIAFGLNMLSALLAPSLMILVIFAAKESRSAWNTIVHDWTPALLIHAPLFVGLAAYFIWTLSVGAGGERETPGFGNLAFSLYEFMGFSGLGPPRHVLRAQQDLSVFIPYWPWLTIGLLSTVGVSVVSVVQFLGHPRGYRAGLVIALVIGLTVFVIAASVVNFRFWGRHLAFFFPLFCLILMSTVGPTEAGPRWSLFRSIAVFALACAWFVSDTRLLALARYQKDDYRGAAKVALDVAQRSNGTVLWAANFIAGRYYGLEFEQPLDGIRWPSVGRAVYAANWNRKQVAEYLITITSQAPFVLVLSKPDLYDVGGNWTAAINDLNARKVGSLNTFDIYIFDKGLAEVPASMGGVKFQEH
jgi:hypothetical protein